MVKYYKVDDNGKINRLRHAKMEIESNITKVMDHVKKLLGDNEYHAKKNGSQQQESE